MHCEINSMGYLDKLLSQCHDNMLTLRQTRLSQSKILLSMATVPFSVVHCRKIRQFVADIAQKSGTLIRTKQHYTINQ